MRVFEVKIRKGRKENECKFTWPSWWGAHRSINIVAYEDHPDKKRSI